jgi:putative addiction module component (TIGR02574 family)
MATVVEEIEAKIRSLNAAEKTELLRSLIAELDGPPQSDSEDEWIATAKKRYREIADGHIKAVPADHVFEKVRSRLKQ